MGEVEPTAQHNHPKTKLRRGINYNSMFSNYKLFCGNPDGQEPGLNWSPATPQQMFLYISQLSSEVSD